MPTATTTTTKQKLTPNELLIRNTRMYEAKLRGDTSREIGQREGLHHGQVDRILRKLKLNPGARRWTPLPIPEKMATVKSAKSKQNKITPLEKLRRSNAKPVSVAEVAGRNGKSKSNAKASCSLSLIDAACIILQRSEVAMHPKEIVAEVLAEKLWTGTGATPFATLWSQLLAEIKRDEKEKTRTSRFRLVKPGIFGLTARGREWKAGE